MPTSDRKIIANRLNGSKSPGPTNTSSTRYNARTHSLLAVGVTELDDGEGYQSTLGDLIREKDPVGVIETFLVKSAALDMVRWVRARRLEAEFITGSMNPPQREKNFLGDFDLEVQGPILDPGLPAPLGAGSVQCLVNTFQRYESMFANRLIRLLHELERLQRMRRGESLPAPAAVDLSVVETSRAADLSPIRPEQPRAIPSGEESLPEPVEVDVIDPDGGVVSSLPPEQAKAMPSDDERLPEPVAVDVIDPDGGGVGSASAESEQQQVLSADGENSAALTADGAGGTVRIGDSAPVAWRPRARSGAIWNDK